MVAIKRLDKGDILLKEGDQSASMYWLQSGSMRLFKKKGNGFIELGVLHAGELVGEMSFLDNEPRSASVEAMQSCEMIEIPRGKFDEVMKNQPNWLNSLVQTLVKRLRNTNNRLREIESASLVYKQDEDGKTQKQHEFISTNELLRLCSALLLAGSRRGELCSDRTVKLNSSWLHTFGGNIMNVPVAKVSTFMDVLEEAGVVRIEKQKDLTDIFITSLDFIDKFIQWLNDENLKTDEKRLQLTPKGIIICDMIYQYGELGKLGNQDSVPINMQAVFQKASEQLSTKLPFDFGVFSELVKCDLASELRVVSSEEKTTQLNLKKFKVLYPFLNLRQRFIDLNEIKRSQV